MPATLTPGDRLRAALGRLGLTQKAAAERLGIKQPSLHDYLSGKRTPTLDWLHDAAGKLGIDPAQLDFRLASRGRKNSGQNRR